MRSPSTYNQNNVEHKTPRGGVGLPFISPKREVFAKRGFTLIEILVVTAIFTVALGLGLFMSMDTYRAYNARSEAGTVISLLQKARSRAMANINQSPWGVCYISPDYILFKGSNCTVGAANESIQASANVSITGLSAAAPVVFAELSGTTTGGVVVITQNGRTSTTTVNYEGTIIW